MGATMTIARDFLQILRRCNEKAPLPAVRALHLPPAGVESKTAEFCAVELEDGALGLSYVLLGDTLAELHAGAPGMVGLFHPLVEPILGSGARLTVVELRPDPAGEREGWRVTLDPAELAACNKVLATSTVLLNDTLDAILGHCRNARAIAMIGPGAACLPDPLFARGITLMGGSWIRDRTGFLQALAAGESWSRHAYKFALTPEAYPGWKSLAV